MSLLLLFSVAASVLVVSLTSSQSCPYRDCVGVTNKCNVTLYVQRTSLDGPEGQPTHVQAVNPGQTQVIDVSGWQGLSGQRLYAWWVYPINANVNGVTMRDKVEINLCGSDASPKMCYNPTAVDYLGLPVNIGPQNSNDCPNVPMTGANLRLSQVNAHTCPTTYVRTPPLGVCDSAGMSCAVNPNQAFCKALDPVLSQCVRDGNCQNGVTTAQAYGCSGWFAQQPKWCSAVNRGVYAAVAGGGSENDPSQFYRNAPYNAFSAWVHTGLAKEYAFPYDDYEGAGASGYNDCTTNYLKVVWCPQG